MLVGEGEPGSGAKVTARGSKWRAPEEFESAKERKAIDEEVLEQALSAAMTCTILAAAGP